MREKKLYHVIGFATTTQAMGFEAFCQKEGLPGRLIPLPEEISAGCGLAWRMTQAEWEDSHPRLAAAGQTGEAEADICMF